DYLWMSAAWAYAARVTAAMAFDGWPARTRGADGGRVEGLPSRPLRTIEGQTVNCPTEIILGDRRGQVLSELGFLPLCFTAPLFAPVFTGSQTCPRPVPGEEAAAWLDYRLAVSLFMRHLLLLYRSGIAHGADAAQCERVLNSWLAQYVCNPAKADEETRIHR